MNGWSNYTASDACLVLSLANLKIIIPYITANLQLLINVSWVSAILLAPVACLLGEGTSSW